MSSRANWEKGEWFGRWIRGRGFGEVFVALDKSSNDLVAIKRVKPMIEDTGIETELELLKACQSPFIVQYYNAVRREGELWVCYY